MDKDLGDELRAFKRKKINFPKKILNAFIDYYKSSNLKSEILLFIPSNKNNNIMNFFADNISKELNIKKENALIFNNEIKEQKYLETLKEREENIKNAFNIILPEKLINKKILLIDDVFASGFTLKEAIKLLKENNIKNIECIVFCYRNHIFL
ncbi:ComF family protein [Brachyspira aalborgi]|uniref:ComF family protein n=1 Tax=Brachyspira aalborgi TaxID=29522 RepID=A0A5C8F4U0_9SPIR|nr:phosphoribosyltransferase family protein [Brachyspira aalborgi]MBS4763731.1 ComF family protein [Brachyspira sp.]CCY75826.1 comFC Predicted amidophosphoribosyltransferase [Brachyspira sp. CAG:700]TXJ31122.1 ComF family protein [Brachyspira aalborgi]TXJ44519.1 ComF family protein [Brachyspira aalborgi]TXJ55554.1 ComF family protein [Brachyspira aalborgi]